MTYTRDSAGRLHCRHGLLLHGTGCVTCDREALPLSMDAFQAEMARRSRWTDTATRNPVEIITDPSDRRGFHARPARSAA